MSDEQNDLDHDVSTDMADIEERARLQWLCDTIDRAVERIDDKDPILKDILAKREKLRCKQGRN